MVKMGWYTLNWLEFIRLLFAEVLVGGRRKEESQEVTWRASVWSFPRHQPAVLVCLSWARWYRRHPGLWVKALPHQCRRHRRPRQERAGAKGPAMKRHRRVTWQMVNFWETSFSSKVTGCKLGFWKKKHEQRTAAWFKSSTCWVQGGYAQGGYGPDFSTSSVFGAAGPYSGKGASKGGKAPVKGSPNTVAERQRGMTPRGMARLSYGLLQIPGLFGYFFVGDRWS